MDRSLPETISVLPHISRPRQQVLKTFDTTAQQYGTFFAGFMWQCFCTGTYRSRISRSAAEKQFAIFLSRLREAVKAPVSCIAVPEYRTSGLRHPGIPLHWHFLLATAPRFHASLACQARRLWERHLGDVRIDPYDRTRAGAHYIAKLASHTDFHYLAENLDRLTYEGPLDIYRYIQTDPYVPDHVRHRTHGQTLVLRAVAA